MTQTFGTGTFGSNVETFDGRLITPVDITYVQGSYIPVTERATFDLGIEPRGSYMGVYASPSYVPAARPEASSRPSVSGLAEYRPTYEKIGTP